MKTNHIHRYSAVTVFSMIILKFQHNESLIY